MTMRYRETMRAARIEGAKAGRSAASWWDDPRNDYAAVLDGIDAGDPKTLDALPWLDLSGQWADGTTDGDILSRCVVGCDATEADWADGTVDEVVNAFRDAHDDALRAEVERICRFHVSTV
jgi:hypothetical protein